MSHYDDARPVPARTLSVPIQLHDPRFAGLALLLVAVLVVAYMFLSSSFRVTRVVLVGRDLPAGEIEAAAGVRGANIFTLNSGDILQRLQRAHDVTVTGVELDLPGTVRIWAVRRLPVLVWLDRGVPYLVDASGHVLTVGREPGLPVVHDTTHRPLAPGSQLDASEIVAISYAQRSLSDQQIRKIMVGRRRGIMVRSAHGWVAVLGTPSGHTLLLRVATLRALLTSTRAQGRRLAYVDLRYHTPYARFATP